MTQPTWINGTVAAIVNPRSANGRTGRIWPRIHAELRKVLGEVEVFRTESPQHATDLTAAAIQAGHRTVLAIGGDGTVNEVVNGFFRDGRAAVSEVVLGVIPQGTGSDFRRALRLPLDERAAIRAIQTADARPVDVMRVAYRNSEGITLSRYAVNVVSFGMGGAVAARVNQTSKALGGRVSFLIATVATTLKFQGNKVSLRIDGAELPNVSITNVAVGNGPYHGGGMWACPRAVMDDGVLEVTIIENMPAWEILRDIAYLYNGRIYEHPKVRYSRATRLEATSDQPTLLEIDGEPLGQLPLEIEIIPKAIRVLGNDE
jgi:YegS/Rv2252/BmrU family lipid kinase